MNNMYIPEEQCYLDFLKLRNNLLSQGSCAWTAYMLLVLLLQLQIAKHGKDRKKEECHC